MAIPRIAVFRPAESLAADLSDLFVAHEYSLRVIDSTADIINLQQEETQEFDVVIIPALTAANLGPMSVCAQCRAEPALQTTPLLVIASKDLENELLSGMYGAGADVVMTQPLPPEALFHQICALSRIKRSHSERLNKQLQSAAIAHPVVQAFDSMREGFLLFDSNFNLVFSNLVALDMLGSSTGSDVSLPHNVARQFLPWLKEHLAEYQLAEPQEKANFRTQFEADLLRTDGQSFSSSVTITSIFQENGQTLGQAIFLSDLGEIRHLGNLLMQAQRTRSLCLLAASTSQQLICDMLGGTVLAPYRAMQQYLDSRPRQCQLEQVVSDLMETLDLLINPNVGIKLNLAENCVLAISSSDLFVMLGHIVLHAVEHAGIRGEVIIQSMAPDLSRNCAIMVSSQTRRQSSFVARDRIGRLIQHDLGSLASFEDLSDKTGLGLHVAQNIAESYGTGIDIDNSEGTTVRLRIKLPVQQ